MPAKKNASAKADGRSVVTPQSAAYEKALADYTAALELFHKGDFGAARSSLEKLLGTLRDEPVLAERARMQIAICERRLTPQNATPQDADELYYQAVVKCNDGELDDSIRLLDQALQQAPGSARLLYARASAWALKGNADAAVADLRQAISIEPTIRFQAVNDSDFSQIREEPAFIDIIEPTPTGA